MLPIKYVSFDFAVGDHIPELGDVESMVPEDNDRFL